MNILANIRFIIEAAVIVALIIFFMLFRNAEKQKEDFKEMLSNQSKAITITKLKDGTSVTKTSVDQVKTTQAVKIELEKDSSLNALRTELGIRIRQIKGFQKTTSVTNFNFHQHLLDTTIKGISDKTYVYRDKFVTVNGVIQNDSLMCDVNIIDSLTQFTFHKRDKVAKWLFGGIGIGHKEYFNEIRSSNPHTKIVYDKRLELN